MMTMEKQDIETKDLVGLGEGLAGLASAIASIAQGIQRLSMPCRSIWERLGTVAEWEGRTYAVRFLPVAFPNPQSGPRPGPSSAPM